MNVAFSGVATELKKSNLRRLGVGEVNGSWTSDFGKFKDQSLGQSKTSKPTSYNPFNLSMCLILHKSS